MTKFGKLLLIVILIVILVVVVFFFQKPVVDVNPPPEDNIILREILGNKDDLISFSILPNSKVQGVVSYQGAVKGGYFFEANILINILDANKNVLKTSNAIAMTDWMTIEPVEFEGNIDFTNLPKGLAYIEIHNDNPSGLPENDKSVLIPIVID
ncbi:hypothetical protein CO033_01680 [Candidatus Nomurabacteria bacterium CG_4_9_14_0_2_um_filter_32_10]|uniref:Bacterial spore germination immunoglobulin-like domain-containing protein n=3 Tax=Candidatus Nomuraibacteriota TaxID=1752729 RepID=A0A2H0CFQ8_9BACT|nr:MAG: hypothetical protein COW91_03135 [Candidatus Nomurabacteria bacterium CG22_combo_CG10-13_8_21_14_all_32_8]PIZ86286.1 MAG: hypothetical protein COX94_00560 [Candidatus Nomurabacteria bacterium CG_4_10_14_0_2_um_filter_33_9]PJC49405.1 MAG: hypothetical protein CO033_01680 [Candidatus Nomurabacteria bacterium CG_4_9_14_0_2_um_filter_32_10]